jgi:hypothetical protein
MNFKLINKFDKDLNNKIFEFCKTSKPLDFCLISSASLRKTKINEFITYLQSEQLNYLITSDDNEEIFISLKKINNNIKMLFVMNISFNHKNINKALNEFYSFLFCENPQCEYIYSDISRKFKLKKYLSWIKKYAKSCKVKFDNDKIVAYWYKTNVE